MSLAGVFSFLEIVMSPTATQPESAMIDVRTVAGKIDVSTRTVARLIAEGKIPQPAKVGALNRWPRTVIDKWIEDGCPSL
jgi:excisionase family DNA binding protein